MQIIYYVRKSFNLFLKVSLSPNKVVEKSLNKTALHIRVQDIYSDLIRYSHKRLQINNIEGLMLRKNFLYVHTLYSYQSLCT